MFSSQGIGRIWNYNSKKSSTILFRTIATGRRIPVIFIRFDRPSGWYYTTAYQILSSGGLHEPGRRALSTPMIPTPDLSHLTRKDYDLVYEPAGTKQPHTLLSLSHPQTRSLNPHPLFRRTEDTFVLLDALEQDAEQLRKLQPSVCLEVG